MPEQKSMPRRKSTLPVRIVGALVMGGLTVAFFGFGVNKVTGSDMLQEITEFSTTPALWITNLIFPNGPHSGLGLQYWNWVYWPSGVLFYTLVWFILITMLWRTRRTVYS
jgi:hypothetical protein